MLKLRRGVRLESLGLPFRRALEAASRLGADGVEINARTEVRPAELTRTGVRQIKKFLDDARLRVCCVNFPTRHGYATIDDLDRRVEATRDAMTMAWDLGCTVLCNQIGAIPPIDAPEHSTLVQALEDIGRHGQRVGAHLAARTGNESGEALGEFIGRLSPATLFVDFDPAELMLERHDVVAAMRELAGHVIHFRARDAVRDRAAGQNIAVQLGRGSVDFPALLALLEEQGYDGFLTVQRSGGDNATAELAAELVYLGEVFSGN